MDYNTIKKILQKYWEGETSLEEEMLLKRYFNSDKVATDLEQYRPLFAYFGAQKTKTSKHNFETLGQAEKRPVRRLFPSWFMAVASVLILLSVAFHFYNNEQTTAKEDPRLMADTYKDPDVAFEEAKAALFLISKGLNKGMKKTKEGVKKAKK